MEVIAFENPAETIRAEILGARRGLCRLEITEVDGRQRFFDMERTRFAVETDAIPVKHAVGGIGVLLDFGDDKAGIKGMDAPGRHE